MLRMAEHTQKIALGLIMLVVALAIGFEVGRGYTEAANAKAEVARAHAITKRVESNAETARTQAATNINIREDFHEETATVKRVRAEPVPGGVRVAARCRAAPRSAEAESAARSDAPTTAPGLLPTDAPMRSDGGTGVELSDSAAQQVRDRREEADLIVTSCRAAQEFITRNGMAP